MSCFLYCRDTPPQIRLTNLPGQWLQYQANGSNVCRGLRASVAGFAVPLSSEEGTPQKVSGLLPESPGQDLALTVLCVPRWLDSVGYVAGLAVSWFLASLVGWSWVPGWVPGSQPTQAHTQQTGWLAHPLTDGDDVHTTDVPCSLTVCLAASLPLCLPVCLSVS